MDVGHAESKRNPFAKRAALAHSLRCRLEAERRLQKLLHRTRVDALCRR